MHEASALVHQFALPLHKSGGTGGASQAGTGSIAGFPAASRKTSGGYAIPGPTLQAGATVCKAMISGTLLLES